MDHLPLDALNNLYGLNLSKAGLKRLNQGFINDTYLVRDANTKGFILQRLNQNVFSEINGLHQNILSALRAIDHFDASSLKLYTTKNGLPYVTLEHNVWRIYSYLENSITYNFAPNIDIAFEAGKLISRFHAALRNENPENYTWTLPHLNHLSHWLDQYKTTLAQCTVEKLKRLKNEIQFITGHSLRFDGFYTANLPLRICHNDTKLNNMLFDRDHKGIEMLDLDTVMPGYFAYDFGDAVRTIVSGCVENESQLDRIGFDPSYFKAFLEGLRSYSIGLNSTELNTLHYGIYLMPFMHGIRALTDYLNNNIYYRVSYPEENLDRARSLFAFTKAALRQSDSIETSIKTVLK